MQYLDVLGLRKTMDRKILLTPIKEKRAISPIIATLLLILIAIAAGVVVYAYVINFVGNSSSNSGSTTSVISIGDFCASSAADACSGTNDYYISVLNTGTVSIPANAVVQVYWTDVTAGTSGSTTCTIPNSAVAPGNSYTCAANEASGSEWNGLGITAPSVGDTLSVKLVNPDGGSATSSTKVIG